MVKYLIRFSEEEWSATGLGVRSKEYINGKQRIRLVEFSEGFVEHDWCIKGKRVEELRQERRQIIGE